jgi:hypothetical protein
MAAGLFLIQFPEFLYRAQDEERRNHIYRQQHFRQRAVTTSSDEERNVRGHQHRQNDEQGNFSFVA